MPVVLIEHKLLWKIISEVRYFNFVFVSSFLYEQKEEEMRKNMW